MDAEAEQGIAVSVAVVRRRRAAVVDVRDRVDRTRRVTVLGAARERRSGRGRERSPESRLEYSR
jgi:hypothetical protein